MPNITNEPFNLDEAKKALSIATSIDDHDEDIERLIVAVREEAERLCGIPIINQSKTLWLDKWPGGEELEWWDGIRDGAISAGELGEVKLPEGNLQSVTSVKVYAADDSSTVVGTTVYYVDTTRNRLVRRTGQSWPAVGRRANGIEIVMQMGYSAPRLIPQDLKERMKERLLQRWRVRGDPDQDKPANVWFYGSWTSPKFGLLNR